VKANVSTTLAKPVGGLTPRDRQALANFFEIDTRALTSVRIGLAAIILYQSLTTPLPVDAGPGLGELVVDNVRLLIVPPALMLLVGYRTRLATVVCWVLYGLPLRPEMLTSGGVVPLESYMMTLFLFWGAFLPLGAHLSWDARRGTGDIRAGRVLSVASAGFLVQMFIIYFSAGVTKHMGEWVVEASALETIFGLPKYTGDVGRAMLAFPAILAVGSILTVVLEIFGSLLLFIPGRTLKTRRTLVALAFVGFHLALAVFMSPIGRFPYVMMVVWLAFLPSSFWDRVTRRPATTESFTDTNRHRNLLAGAALVYVFVSNLITWLYYPAREGFPAMWQELGRYLLLYQQWAMFSVPSSL
jgi:hypothetical protein